MRIVHKPVALAWRQRASAALRARAAATLPYRAFVNNSHDFGTYKNRKGMKEMASKKAAEMHSLVHPFGGRDPAK